MKMIKLPAADLMVSRIGYGCGSLGGWEPGPLSSQKAAQAVRLVNAAVEAGVNFFDLADIYGLGKAEEALGCALRQEPSLRDRIVIQTKCGQNVAPDWGFGQPIGVESSREYIINAAEASLARLRTDHVDIFLLHLPDALMEPDEVASAFDALATSGKVLHFGISNFTPPQIELLQRATDHKLVANQVSLSLGQPQLIADGYATSIECARGTLDFRHVGGIAGTGTLDYCRLNNIQVQAYSPLKGGLLDAEDAPWHGKATAELVAALAAAKGVSTTAIILAWLLRHPAGIVPFIGTGNRRHMEEVLRAVDVQLSRQEWYQLLVSRTPVLPCGAALA
jgi:predicted oxidoreductase